MGSGEVVSDGDTEESPSPSLTTLPPPVLYLSSGHKQNVTAQAFTFQEAMPVYFPLVPTLCVGMNTETLCVSAGANWTQSVQDAFQRGALERGMVTKI